MSNAFLISYPHQHKPKPACPGAIAAFRFYLAHNIHGNTWLWWQVLLLPALTSGVASGYNCGQTDSRIHHGRWWGQLSEVVDLLADLIAIPSVNPGSATSVDPSGGEAEIIAYIEDRLVREGIACQRQAVAEGRDNLIAIIEGRSEQAILLESHTDTVGTANMTIAPFTPQIRGERVYGRGACDTKASVAAMLTAIERLASNGIPEHSCLWAATVDEEYLFQGISKFVEEGPPLPVVGAVVGEPTKLDVVIRHKGRVWLEVAVYGRAAHSSHPEQGDNAIYHASSLIQAFAQYGEQLATETQDSAIGPATCAVTVVHGGDVINIIPDRCLLRLDRRILPGEEPADVLAKLEEIAQETAGDSFSCETKTVMLDPPLNLDVQIPFISHCQKVAQSICPQAKVTGCAFSTHGSRLAEIGIPTVVLGPGDIAVAHSSEEWVNIKQLELAAEIYYRLCCY